MWGFRLDRGRHWPIPYSDGNSSQRPENFDMAYSSRDSQGGGYQNKRKSNIKRAPKRDPIYIDGQAPRPMYVDYKDLDLLSKLTNRHGRIVSRRKTGCHAASQHAVARAIKRARFMALLPYVGD
jgi:small subunit ribosomal protein S18